MFLIGRSRLAKARSSGIHGTGLFAKRDIPAGEKIIEYTGEKITKAEGNRRYDEQAKKNQIYLFELNSRYDIDGSARGNIAKYANHSCDPNAETVVEKGEIWLLAMKDIKKGEEITFDYNFPLYDYEKRPCRCGSENCRTWIINQDSYYYLRRKDRLAGRNGRKGEKRPAGRRGTKKAGKAAKKGTKKAAKRSQKKGRKGPGRKKKAARKAIKKGTKEAGKRSAKKGRKGKKGRKQKAAKKAAGKSRS